MDNKKELAWFSTVLETYAKNGLEVCAIIGASPDMEQTSIVPSQYIMDAFRKNNIPPDIALKALQIFLQDIVNKFGTKYIRVEVVNSKDPFKPSIN